MKELEENNVLDNEFLNLLGEPESTLENDYILGATDDIGEESGDDTCEKNECEEDGRACVGDKCPTDGICVKDECRGDGGCECDTDAQVTYYYRIMVNMQIKSYYRNDFSYAEMQPTILSQPSSANVNPINVSLTNFLKPTLTGWTGLYNTSFSTKITSVSGTSTYSSFGTATSGQYSASPFCTISTTGTALGCITSGLSINFYIQASTSSMPANWTPPTQTFYLKENFVNFEIKDENSNKIQYVAFRSPNDYIYFPRHLDSSRSVINTGSQGHIQLSSKFLSGLTYITGEIYRKGFNNDSWKPITAYTDTYNQSIYLSHNTGNIQQRCNLGEIRTYIHPAIYNFITETNTGRLYTLPQLISDGADDVSTFQLPRDAVMSLTDILSITPFPKSLVSDEEYGKGNPIFLTKASSTTIPTSQIALGSFTFNSLCTYELKLTFNVTGSYTGYLDFYANVNGGTNRKFATVSMSNSNKEATLTLNYSAAAGNSTTSNFNYTFNLRVLKQSTSNAPTIVLPRGIYFAVCVDGSDYNGTTLS